MKEFIPEKDMFLISNSQVEKLPNLYNKIKTMGGTTSNSCNSVKAGNNFIIGNLNVGLLDKDITKKFGSTLTLDNLNYPYYDLLTGVILINIDKNNNIEIVGTCIDDSFLLVKDKTKNQDYIKDILTKLVNSVTRVTNGKIWLGLNIKGSSWKTYLNNYLSLGFSHPIISKEITPLGHNVNGVVLGLMYNQGKVTEKEINAELKKALSLANAIIDLEEVCKVKFSIPQFLLEIIKNQMLQGKDKYRGEFSVNQVKNNNFYDLCIPLASLKINEPLASAPLILWETRPQIYNDYTDILPSPSNLAHLVHLNKNNGIIFYIFTSLGIFPLSLTTEMMRFILLIWGSCEEELYKILFDKIWEIYKKLDASDLLNSFIKNIGNLNLSNILTDSIILTSCASKFVSNINFKIFWIVYLPWEKGNEYVSVNYLKFTHSCILPLFSDPIIDPNYIVFRKPNTPTREKPKESKIVVTIEKSLEKMPIVKVKSPPKRATKKQQDTLPTTKILQSPKTKKSTKFDVTSSVISQKDELPKYMKDITTTDPTPINREISRGMVKCFLLKDFDQYVLTTAKSYYPDIAKAIKNIAPEDKQKRREENNKLREQYVRYLGYNSHEDYRNMYGLLSDYALKKGYRDTDAYFISRGYRNTIEVLNILPRMGPKFNANPDEYARLRGYRDMFDMIDNSEKYKKI